MRDGQKEGWLDRHKHDHKVQRVAKAVESAVMPLGKSVDALAEGIEIFFEMALPLERILGGTVGGVGIDGNLGINNEAAVRAKVENHIWTALLGIPVFVNALGGEKPVPLRMPEASSAF